MKENFLLKYQHADIFESLSDEDAGKLIKGIFNYVTTGESNLDGLMKTIFIPIKKDIDKNEENYQKRCEKNRENINKRWNKDIPEDTNEYDGIKKEENGYESIPNDTDNNHISYITTHNINNHKKDNRVIGEEEKKEPKDKYDKEIYDGIIDYLNFKAGTKYKSTSENNKKHIRARLNDGFIPDDFKVVIDNMTSKWLNDEKMSRYLRPETLFGNKFESYLNEIPRKTIPKKLSEISMEEIDRAIELEKEKNRS